MKDLVQKNPQEVIFRAVKGMLAKNTIRGILLEKNLIIHEGPYHPHLAQKLPQFIAQQPKDLNKEIGIDSFTPEDTTVIFESNKNELPEEYKNIPRDIDTESGIDTPIPLSRKTHKFSNKTIRESISIKNQWR
jgi:hypothetical protein